MMIYALAPGHEDLGGRTIPASHTSAHPHETQVIRVSDVSTMNWLANDIKNRVDTFRRETGRTETKIWVLRIASHGNSGFVEIGDGLDIFTAHEFRVLQGNYFSPEGRGIEIWGCAVAAARPIETYEADREGGAWSSLEAARLHNEYETQLRRANYIEELQRGEAYPTILRGSREVAHSVTNGEGYRMMNALAQAAQIKVTAGFDIQFAQLGGEEWEWDGTALLEVRPSGDYTIITL